MQVQDKLRNRHAFEWMQEPEGTEIISKVMEADIVIVGAGHAGTSAARAASEIPGVRVVVVEQQAREHQRILGIGEVGHINSRWQESYGVPKVDIDEFVNDWQMRTNNRSDYRLIRKYAEKCGDCFDWFIEPLTEEEKGKMYPMLQNPSKNMPKTLNGIHAYPGTAYMTVEIQNSAVKKNQALAQKQGAEFLFETKAKRLLRNEKRITGIVVEQKDGSYIQINVSKGVILAAGDYSRKRQIYWIMIPTGWGTAGMAAVFRWAYGLEAGWNRVPMRQWEEIILCPDLR